MKSRLLLSLALLLPLGAWCHTDRDITLSRTDSQGRRITLAGTLTTPDGRAPRGGWPAMLLITGSGPENRDEEILGHKPFKAIAEYMASQGIATLRFDDRGVGGSTGAFADVTIFDLADDAEAEWNRLCHTRGINPRRVGLLGHSEGSTIALIVAARQPQAAFVISMAGPGVTMRQNLLRQNQDIFALRGLPDSLISRRLDYMRDVFDSVDSLAAIDTAGIVKRFNLAFRQYKDNRAAGLSKSEKQAAGLTNQECYAWALTMSQPYMLRLLDLDPADYISRLACPLLAVNGDKDCQVDCNTNLRAILSAYRDSGGHIQTRIYTDRNHLFQQCQTGAVEEYQSLGQSPDPAVLADLSRWILSVL